MNSPFPRITIVTPSFNQALYVEATIQSVLDQSYPNLEYFVLDAGSTDGTIEILRRYEPQLNRLVIEPDAGSADAINKGLAMATGEWFNWLNSDDLLLPGALHLLAEHIARNPQANWISGCKLNIDSSGRCVSSEAPWQQNLAFHLLGDALFPQDATFIRRSFLASTGICLNAGLANVYDTVLYLQLLQHDRPLLVSSVFSAMRWHPAQKTADVQRRASEARYIHQELVKLQNWPWMRVARKLASTRFARQFRFFFLILAMLRLWPSRLDWPVEVFQPWRQEYLRLRVRDCLLL